jgi:hypothetical protein
VRSIPAYTWSSCPSADVRLNTLGALTRRSARPILDGMLLTRRSPWRIGLLVALLGGLLLLPAAFAAVRADAPTLTVDSTAVNASWKEGWLRPGAAVRFTGTAGQASTLTATLRPVDRPGVVTARLPDFSAGPGAFSKTLPLPARPLPGAYRLHVASVGPAPRPAPVDVMLRIPAPPEGVIDRALVGTSLNGPWLRYVGNTGPAVHGSHRTLWVRFRFLYPPRAGRVELVWKLQWRRVVGKVHRRYKNTIDTFARSSTPLPKGTWLVVLKINGRVAKQMSVRLL